MQFSAVADEPNRIYQPGGDAVHVPSQHVAASRELLLEETNPRRDEGMQMEADHMNASYSHETLQMTSADHTQTNVTG